MRYTSSQYAKTLYEMLETTAKDDHKKLIGEFVNTLIRHNRLNLARSIILDFEKVWYEKNDVAKVQIESAVGKHLNGEKLLRQALGKNIEVTEKISPELLGGARITVGDMRIDDTVKRRMEDLNRAIVG